MRIAAVVLGSALLVPDGAAYGTVVRTFLQIRSNVAVDDAMFRPPSGVR